MTAEQQASPSSVQAAIHQTKPFRSLGQETLIGLMLANEAVRRVFHDALADVSELTQQQYNVLRILRGAGAAGLPTLAIAERMIERTPGMTRMIDRLERKGLVARERSAEDRRQVLCRLTPEGKKTLRKLDPVVEGIDDSVMTALTQKEQRELLRLLNKVRLSTSA